MDFLSPGHLILISVIAVVVLGPERLPEIMAGLGRAYRTISEAKNVVWGALEGNQANLRGLFDVGPTETTAIGRSLPEPGITSAPALAAPPPYVSRDGAPLAPPY